MFDEDGLGNYGTDAARTRKSGDGREEMDEKDHEIAHFRMVPRNSKTRGIPGKLAIRHGQVVTKFLPSTIQEFTAILLCNFNLDNPSWPCSHWGRFNPI